jgi:organic radical activating enzyme
MNLQVNSPYTKCPYRCPYCVAGVMGVYPFSDHCYRDTPWLYFTLLERAISRYGIDTVVITGSTEPTLFPKWIEEVCRNIPQHVRVELQTKNYKWAETYDTINVIAYSNDCIPTRERTKQNFIVRDVFLWNKELTSSMIIKYFQSQPNVDQCTVKQLVSSSYSTPTIDEYIKTIYKNLTFTDKAILKENNIWVDEDCSASENRYLIYRTNGHIYEKWSDIRPIG